MIDGSAGACEWRESYPPPTEGTAVSEVAPYPDDGRANIADLYESVADDSTTPDSPAILPNDAWEA